MARQHRWLEIASPVLVALLLWLVGGNAQATVIGGIQQATAEVVILDVSVEDGVCLVLVGLKELTAFRQAHVWLYALAQPGNRHAFRQCSELQRLLTKRPLQEARSRTACLKFKPDWRKWRSGDESSPFELLRVTEQLHCLTQP